MSFHDFHEYSQDIVQRAADIWVRDSEECILPKRWLEKDTSERGQRFILRIMNDREDPKSAYFHIDWLLEAIVISIESPTWLLLNRFPPYFKHEKGKFVHTWVASISLEELWRQIRVLHDVRDEACIMDVYKAMQMAYRLLESNIRWTEVGWTPSGLKKVYNGDTKKLDWDLRDDRDFIQKVRDRMASPVQKGQGSSSYAYFWSEYVDEVRRILLGESHA